MKTIPLNRPNADAFSHRWRNAFLAAVLAGCQMSGVAVAQVGPPAAAPTAACAPAMLTRMVIRDISPGVASADARAQPRTMDRLGSQKFRSEEQPDMTRAGQTRLVVISEPDIWSIDLAQGQGAHSLDPGPELRVVAPVLPNISDLPPLFRTLEFGCEPQFIAAHAATPAQSGSWGATKVGIHMLNLGDHNLTFLVESATGTPVIITYSKAGSVVFALRYDLFRTDLPDELSLFAPPKSVKLVEAQQSAAKP
jgi:hypothetical protein